MQNIIFGIIGGIFTWLVISFIGGFIEDTVWAMADQLVPNCDNLEGNWRDICFENNRAYYSTKTGIQLAGMVGGIIAFYGIFSKL